MGKGLLADRKQGWRKASYRKIHRRVGATGATNPLGSFPVSQAHGRRLDLEPCRWLQCAAVSSVQVRDGGRRFLPQLRIPGPSKLDSRARTIQPSGGESLGCEEIQFQSCPALQTCVW